MQRKIVVTFFVMTNHYAFDVLNGAHTAIIPFILVDFLVWSFAPDWKTYSIPVRSVKVPIIPLFFPPAAHITSAWSWQLYFNFPMFR